MRRGLLAGGVVVALLGLAMLLDERAQFMVGGALVNAGFRLQDSLHTYDFHEHHPSAQAVWEEFRQQNALSSQVRARFPRSTEHPLVALLVCMDARIDTSELAGDTRRYYYVVRTAGSVLGPVEQEMLELAVTNGVKVVVLTRHTDCAAEKAAADPATRQRFPQLVAAVDERAARVEEFLRRPVIAERISNGELLVEQLVIDTRSEQLVELAPAAVR